MNNITNEELLALIDKATAGDKNSLEAVILSVQDLVFNLSLRMLGTFPDAEDATQDILLKIITHLSSFKGDSRIAGDILGITPEAYRQRLSRIRGKMADFLKEYCGEYGNGTCHCADRVNYAIQNHRISPERLDFTAAIPVETMVEVKEAYKRWEFDMENENMTGHWTGIFLQKNGQTEIDFTEEVTVKKPIMKLFIKSYLKKQQETYIKDLRKVLE